MTKLNFDFARCRGVGEVNEADPRIIDWRADCADCLRRTSPDRHEYQSHIEPQRAIVFECENYISPEDYK